jgi:hypothetical protein
MVSFVEQVASHIEAAKQKSPERELLPPWICLHLQTASRLLPVSTAVPMAMLLRRRSVSQQTVLWLRNSGSTPVERSTLQAFCLTNLRRYRRIRSGLISSSDRAVAFSRAAIRGHARSAYYLGQIYETGDGVPADTALALAWYALAGEHARARQRLSELAEQRVSFGQNGESQAEASPQLAFAERSSAGILDLVWIADRGAASAGGYIVELAEEPESSPVLRAFAEVSALRFAYPDTDELWWRVTPVGGTAASSWQRVPYAD